MTDRRELILARIETILSGLSGIRSTWRDRGELQHDQRPAAVLLDGLERADDSAFGRGRPEVIKNLVRLEPEIYIVLPDIKPQNVNIGPTISEWRRLVLLAMAGDTALASILGSNGKVEYLGCETDMQSGSSLEGQLRMDFAFVYVLDPAEL